jgi:hypothetical protein
LETVCKLDIRNTLPELQHEFCGVWNQLVATAQSDPPSHHGFVAMTTLKNIRKLYIALHECSGTPQTTFYTATGSDDWDPILDNPKFYPMCTIDDHLPSHSIPDLQFDEPTPDAGDGPPPVMTPYPTIWLSTSATSFSPSPSTPYHTLSGPTHGLQFLDTYSHLSAPHPDPAVHLPQPQLIRTPHPGVLDNASTTSDSSGGHGQSSRAP